jgi:hypothetical protein
MVAAEWLWKVAIYANLHPLVDNHKSFVVDSGIYLPLFFLEELKSTRLFTKPSGGAGKSGI